MKFWPFGDDSKDEEVEESGRAYLPPDTKTDVERQER